MLIFRNATASQVRPLGPIVAAADGTTAYTSAILAAEILVNKHGSTSEVAKNSGNSTHISGGRHYATFDATDTSAIGQIKIVVAVASQLLWWDTGIVLPAQIYDSLILGAGTDLLQVDIAQVGNSTSALTRFLAACTSMVSATAVTGTLTNTQATTSLGASYATDNQLVNRWIIWLGDVTAQLSGQGSQISAYNGTTKLISYGPIAGGLAPANLDSFVIL